MEKRKYQCPVTEIVSMEVNNLMEVWSIPIDNDDPGIGPGQEGDIGAKQGIFEDNSNWGVENFKPWED